jgi:hypothetical protein
MNMLENVSFEYHHQNRIISLVLMNLTKHLRVLNPLQKQKQLARDKFKKKKLTRCNIFKL